jgi:hypothetical protein
MSDDSIANALDLTPLEPIKQSVIAVKSENDYETAKGNMHNVIDVGTKAMTDLADMAQQSQDPRVYRVLTELISAMTTANKELMEIKSKDVEIRHKEERADGPKTVNQNLFVGMTTAELVTMLQKKEQ